MSLTVPKSRGPAASRGAVRGSTSVGRGQTRGGANVGEDLCRGSSRKCERGRVDGFGRGRSRSCQRFRGPGAVPRCLIPGPGEEGSACEWRHVGVGLVTSVKINKQSLHLGWSLEARRIVIDASRSAPHWPPRGGTDLASRAGGDATLLPQQGEERVPP